jgi:hypothetical protein
MSHGADGSPPNSALWQTKPMAVQKKFEQILSRARELRREAEELIKTSEHLMEQCEMLRRFRDGLLENKGTARRDTDNSKKRGAPAAFDDLATKRSTEPLFQD